MTVMKEEKNDLTLDDINREFQDYQDDLLMREKKLRLPVSFTPDDSLIDLIRSLKEVIPDFTTKDLS